MKKLLILAFLLLAPLSKVYATNLFTWTANSATTSNGTCNFSGAAIDATGGHDGSGAMKVTVPDGGDGQSGCNDLGSGSFGAGTWFSGKTFYFRWWMKIDSGFSFGNRGHNKITRLTQGGSDLLTFYLDTGNINVESINGSGCGGGVCGSVPYNFNGAAAKNYQEYIIALTLQTTSGGTGKVELFVNGASVGSFTHNLYTSASGDFSHATWGNAMCQAFYHQLCNGGSSCGSGGIIWFDDYSVDDVWNSNYVAGPPDTTAPSTPTNLSATATSSSSTNLTWTASTDNVAVTAYRIERCVTAGCTNFAEITTDTASPYSDTGLTPATIYQYRIRATDQAGNLSGYSNTSSVTTDAGTSGSYTSSFPLTENPISEGGVWVNGASTGLDWNNVRTTTGKVFGTQVPNVPNYYSDSTAVLSGIWGADQDVTATVFTTTTTGREVELRLRTTITAHSITGYEVLFVAYSNGATGDVQIVRWNGPVASFTVLGSGGSAVITQGTVVRATITGNTIRAYVNGTQVATATDSTYTTGSPGVGFFLNSGTITDNASFGFTSLTVSSSGATNPPDITVPSNPSGLGAQAAGSGSITLSWTASTDNVGVTGYNVERCAGVSCSTFAQIGTSATNSYNDSAASASTTYGYRVRAYDAAANLSGYSNTATATTPAATATECTATWQTDHPSWIWCDDFEQNRISSYFDSSGQGTFARASGVGFNNTWGMVASWNSGTVDAGSLKLAFGLVPSGGGFTIPAGVDTTTKFQEIYYRAYLKSSANWIGQGAGHNSKYTRATVFTSGAWAQAMIAHLWSNDTGGNNNYLLIDPASCVTGSTVNCTGYNGSQLVYLGGTRGNIPIFTSPNAGNWNCIEAHVKLNTVGLSDGIQEFWIDGVLDASRTNLNFRGSYTGYGINAVLFENYINGGASQYQQRWWDNIVVATQRIGCSNAPPVTLPAVPTGLRKIN